jgi:hypothetical protein
MKKEGVDGPDKPGHDDFDFARQFPSLSSRHLLPGSIGGWGKR